MNQQVKDSILRYGFALICVVVMVLVWGFFPRLSSQYPFLLASIPVVAASAYGGFGPGMFASIFGVMSIDLFFIHPRFKIGADPSALAAPLIFLGTSICISYLIAARRRTEAQERATRQWLEVVLGSIADAVVVTDASGRINFMNRAAETLGHSKKQDAIGRNFKNIFHVIDEKTRTELDYSIADVSGNRLEDQFSKSLLLVRLDGTESRVDSLAAQIKDESGNKGGMVLVLRDMQKAHMAELRLRATEERLRFALEAGNMGAWDWNILTNELKWIGSLERIHGLSPNQFGETMDEFVQLIHPDDRSKVDQDIQNALNSIGPFSTEFRVQWPDGSLHWVGGVGKAIANRDGKAVRLLGIGLDLTEIKRQQQQMQFVAEATRVLSSVLEPEAILRTIAKMIIPQFADWCRTTLLQDDGDVKTVGLFHIDPEKEDLLVKLLELYPPGPDDPGGPHHILKTNQSVIFKEISPQLLAESAKSPEHLEMLRSLHAKSYMCVPLRARGRILGTIGFISADHGRLYTDSDLAFAEDVATRVGLAVDNARLYQESRKAQEVLFLQLRQNEVLLKEMNHRVKNNLQVISSLLRLQSRYADDHSREMLLESQNRIHTMALIHEKLYGSQNLTQVDLQSYLKDLAESLFDSYSVDQARIALELKCEGEYLDLDKAISCGLLINEIVTNSLKHAFPENRSGNIWIRFRGQNGRFRLELGDDGIGLAEELDMKNAKTLGIRLISNLVTQLHGNLKIDRAKGTNYQVDFR